NHPPPVWRDIRVQSHAHGVTIIQNSLYGSVPVNDTTYTARPSRLLRVFAFDTSNSSRTHAGVVTSVALPGPPDASLQPGQQNFLGTWGAGRLVVGTIRKEGASRRTCEVWS